MAEKKARVEPAGSVPERDRQGAQESEPRISVDESESAPGEQRAAEDDRGGSDSERIARLEVELAGVAAELAETKDKWTRALAEAENVRRRAERDRRDAEAYGGTRLARDVLGVWDNLERALKVADDELKAKHGAFIEGVELTQRELLNAFAKHKIEKVTPEKGARFDPNRHQAMFEAPIPGAEPGTIIEVMQDGFVIADRLLRPALVGVARAAPEEAGTEAPPSDTQGEGGSEGP